MTSMNRPNRTSTNRLPDMRTLRDPDLLALWEQGASRHALDRTVLLCAAARGDLPAAAIPDLALGEVNESLIRLRSALFGARLECGADCARCGAPFEVAVEMDALLQPVAAARRQAGCTVGGRRLRLPSLRDLAAVSTAADVDRAAWRLFARCSGDDGATPCADELAQAGAAIEAADPMTDLVLRAQCPGCGHDVALELDIGQVLWREIEARARSLLGQVHLLAMAYGWSERQILALGAVRRAAYLGMAP